MQARFFLSSILASILLTGCFPTGEPIDQNRWGYGGTDFGAPPPPPTPPSGPPVGALPREPASPSFQPSTPPPPPIAPVHETVPWGIPVEGKPGYIRSPYSPGAGQIDVRGFPPGTEIKDPYNPGKLLMVP